MTKFEFMLILVACLGTYSIRASFLTRKRKFKTSRVFTVALGHIPGACLTGIIIPSLFIIQGQFTWEWERITAFLGAVVATYFFRNLYTAALVGFGLLWAFNFLI